jgi:hypothetical protein
MPGWLSTFRRIVIGWYQAAQHHAATIRRLQKPPLWLALVVVLVDFALVGIWFRHCRDLSIGAWTVSEYMP